MITLFLLLQAAPAASDEARFDRCVDLATGADAAAAEAEAGGWSLAGGGFLARQCLGLSYATRGNYAAAGAAFTEAARGAEVAKDKRAANYWLQAGNAWLASGDHRQARAAVDAALAAGTLTGLALGEAHLDRARVLVAAGDAAGARTDLDRALVLAPGDPLAWLLSATLARRTGDLARAAKDIVEAYTRSPDDAAVQVEAGTIAALSGNTDAARGFFTKALQIAPEGPTATAARAGLEQLPAQ